MILDSFKPQLLEFVCNMNNSKKLQTSISISTIDSSFTLHIDRSNQCTFDDMALELLVFPIACAGKLFVSIMLMQLVDEMALSLDDPIVQHLNDFELQNNEYRDQIKVLDLLNFTTGVDTAIGENHYYNDALAYEKNLKKNEHLFQPGRMFSYGEAGFMLAVRLIEILRGKAWATCISDYILEPIDISVYELKKDLAKDQESEVILLKDASPMSNFELQSCLTTGSGLYIHASDLNKVGQVLLECMQKDNPGHLVSSESASLILGENPNLIAIDGQRPGFGLTRHYQDVCVIEGVTSKSSVSLFLLPKYYLSFAILIDSADTLYNLAISRFIANSLVGSDPFHARHFITPKCKKENQAKFPGVYSCQTSTIKVSFFNERLSAVIDGEAYSLHYARDVQVYLAIPDDNRAGLAAKYISFINVNNENVTDFLLVNYNFAYSRSD